MKKFLLVAWVLLACSPVVGAQSGAIRCGRLLDVRSSKMPADQTALFQDGKVASVGSASSVSLPGGVKPLDLSAATCLPGLIDVHDHLTGDPQHSGYKGLGVSIPRSTVTGVKNARLTLRAGFTTVRNVGASGFADVALRDGINAGEIERPATARFGARARHHWRPL